MTNNTQNTYVVNTPLLKKLKLKLFGKLVKKEVIDYGAFVIELCDYSYRGRDWFLIRKIIK